MTDHEEAVAVDASALLLPKRDGEPLYQVVLWPHRSLSMTGYRKLVVFAAVAFTIPLMTFIGTAAIWIMAPYLALHVWLLWYLVRKSYKDARLTETLRLWPDLITVERREPNGRLRHWHANPYWARLEIHAKAKVEHYLTITGNGREIELGAFLTPEERLELRNSIEDALARARAVTTTAIPSGTD